MITLVILSAALLTFLLTVPRRPAGRRGYAVGAALFVLILGGSTSAPDQVRYVAVVVAAALLLGGAAFGSREAAGARHLLPLLLWFAWVVLVSLHTASSALPTLVLSLGVPLIALVVVPRMNRDDVTPLLRWIGLTVVVQAAVGLAELTFLSAPVWGYRNLSASGSPVVRYNPFLPDLVRVQGTTGHPIVYSVVMMVGLLFLVGLGGSLSRWFRVICSICAVTGLLLAGTRSAFLAIALGLVVFLLLARSSVSRVRNVLVLAGASVVIWFGGFGLSKVTDDALASASFAHRFEGWLSAGQLLDRPMTTVLIGSGLNSETDIFDRGLLQQDGFTVIDNHFIWTVAVTGVVGLGLMLTAIALSWARSGRLGRSLLAVMVVMGFSFDLITWVVSSTLFVLVLALPTDFAGVRPKLVVAEPGSKASPVGAVQEPARSARRTRSQVLPTMRR